MWGRPRGMLRARPAQGEQDPPAAWPERSPAPPEAAPGRPALRPRNICSARGDGPGKAPSSAGETKPPRRERRFLAPQAGNGALCRAGDEPDTEGEAKLPLPVARLRRWRPTPPRPPAPLARRRPRCIPKGPATPPRLLPRAPGRRQAAFPFRSCEAGWGTRRGRSRPGLGRRRRRLLFAAAAAAALRRKGLLAAAARRGWAPLPARAAWSGRRGRRSRIVRAGTGRWCCSGASAGAALGAAPNARLLGRPSAGAFEGLAGPAPPTLSLSLSGGAGRGGGRLGTSGGAAAPGKRAVAGKRKGKRDSGLLGRSAPLRRPSPLPAQASRQLRHPLLDPSGLVPGGGSGRADGTLDLFAPGPEQRPPTHPPIPGPSSAGKRWAISGKL